MNKIGVFICECGPNIKDALDIPELMQFCAGQQDVCLVKSHPLLCSEEGKQFIKDNIKNNSLTHVVIAACSPKEHEATFMKVCQDSQINPYLLQIANIREQCAWVTADKGKATQKAKSLIKGAIQRVILNSALDKKEIECLPDVLVIGSGVAGFQAALTLAQKGRKIYLVEKSPSIGGRAAMFAEIAPKLECASCMLDPKLDEVLHNDKIELFTYSEVQEVLGYFGNFIVKLKQKARHVDTKKCLGCGQCFEVCPVKVKNEFNENLDERKAIYIPYPGALPNIALIDKNTCLYFKDKSCQACKESCGFQAVDFSEEDKIVELKVGAIVLATGFKLFDPRKIPEYGYGKLENVYTGLEFERLINPSGPTQGKVVLKNGNPPKSVAIIHCVGSRDKDYHEYCSGICCLYSLKFAHLIKEKTPSVEVFELYSELCLPGKGYQEFFHSLKDKQINFLRIPWPQHIRINQDNQRLSITYQGLDTKDNRINVDIVILSAAVEPDEGAQKLAELFTLSLDKDGFFAEEHTKLAPVSTLIKGIFIAGCNQGPRDIAGSIAQGEAAAGLALSSLIPGEKFELEAKVSIIDEDLCSGCKICLGVCPYKAISFDKEKKICVVNEVLCRGCGACAAACPANACKHKHSTSEQVFAEIKGIL